MLRDQTIKRGRPSRLGLLGFLNKENKKKGARRNQSAAASNLPKETDNLSSKQKRQLSKALRPANKAYPLLHRLQLPILSLEYLQDHFKDFAENRDGAVRVLHDNDGDAYSVIIITEDMLDEMGFSLDRKHNPDGEHALATLGEEIRVNSIKSATMTRNYQAGQLVIIPTKDTIDAMAEFEEFNNYDDGFWWGGYPTEGMDDLTKAEVLQLKSRVTLAELQSIDAHDSDLQLTPDYAVQIVSDDEQTDNSADNTEANDSFDPTDSLNDESDDMDEDDDELPETPEIPDVTQPAAQPASAPTPKVVPTVAASTPEPSSTVDSSAMADLMSNAGIDDYDNDDGNDDDDVDLSDIPDDLGQTTDNAPMDTLPPMQSQDEYAADFGQVQGAAKAYTETIDKELNLVVDYEHFDNQSKQLKPLSFKIQPVSPDDKLGQLANTYRENYNSQLLANFNRQEAALREVYGQRIRRAGNYISQRLSGINGQNSKLSEMLAKAERDHDASVHDLEAQWPDYRMRKDREFEARKHEAGDAAKVKAEQEYEEENREKHNSDLKAEYEQRHTQIDSQLLQKKKQITEQKVKIAKAAFSSTEVGIMKDVNRVRQANHESNMKLYKQFDKALHDLLNTHYEDEQARQVAAAKTLEHSQAIDDLKKKLEAKNDEWQRKLDQEKTKNKELIDSINNSNAESSKKMRDSYEMTIQQLKDQLNNERGSNASVQESHQRELDTLRQQKDDEIHRLSEKNNEDSKEHDKEMERLQKSGRNISILAIITAVLVGLLIGLGWSALHSKQQAPVQQPQIQQQLPNNSSKKDTGQVNIYTNGNNSSENSSSNNSSSSSHSSSANASSDNNN